MSSPFIAERRPRRDSGVIVSLKMKKQKTFGEGGGFNSLANRQNKSRGELQEFTERKILGGRRDDMSEGESKERRGVVITPRGNKAGKENKLK